jgi:hypothetical protein
MGTTTHLHLDGWPGFSAGHLQASEAGVNGISDVQTFIFFTHYIGVGNYDEVIGLEMLLSHTLS